MQKELTISFQNSIKLDCLILNIVSLPNLVQFPQAAQFLRKAQRIVTDQLAINSQNPKICQLAGVTFNNLACYYKKTKKPKVALSYLTRSLQFQVFRGNDWVSTGSTHLNICAIYSYLQKHEQALKHACLALELLDKKHYNQQDNNEQAKAYFNIRMLCYYNRAIEEEYVKKYLQALESYQKAKQIAKTFGNKNVSIVISCDQAITRIQTLQSELQKKAINLFLRKKDKQQKGFPRLSRSPLKDRPFLSEEKLKKFVYYQRQDLKGKNLRATSLVRKPEENDKKSNLNAKKEIKDIKQYLNGKCKTTSSRQQFSNSKIN